MIKNIILQIKLFLKTGKKILKNVLGFPTHFYPINYYKIVLKDRSQ